MHRTKALQLYGHAWQLRAPEDIRTALNACWTSTSIYTDPMTDPVVGVDGLTAVIVDFGSQFPGASIQPTSPLDTHHNVGRFSWMMTSATQIEISGVSYGTEVLGLDFLEFSPDGRIARVVGFFTAAAGVTQV